MERPPPSEHDPQQLYDGQVDGETVVFETEPTTGAYLSAVREGDRICITLNALGKNAAEEWCDTATARTPESVKEIAVARVGSVRAADGSESLIAYGATHSDVAIVEVPGGGSVRTQRHLPFWAHAFFAVPVGSTTVELRYLDSSGTELAPRFADSA